jgi:hypothetical protein
VTAVSLDRDPLNADLTPATVYPVDPGPAEDWHRYWYTFTLSSWEEIRVAMALDVDTANAAVDVAGLMVEDLSGVTLLPGPEDEPGTWAATTDVLAYPMLACEDTFGENFRTKGWRRNCVPLCTDGFGRDCPPERAQKYCYWETEFTISQNAIDRGRVLTHAGFARGNFNYRVESLAVNFVGARTRDCETSLNPSACYSGGFVPYTLEHIGPYVARNHRGDDYEAPLFKGYIEHARGLAAERYLTNPVSSSDRALIEPFVQRQFRGRPLTGTYKLRVWDEEGVYFGAIEDVQVLLNYRFWTRLD